MAGSWLALLSAAALATLAVINTADASEFSTQTARNRFNRFFLFFSLLVCIPYQQQQQGAGVQLQYPVEHVPCLSATCSRFPNARCEAERCSPRFFVGSTDVTDNCDVGKSLCTN